MISTNHFPTMRLTPTLLLVLLLPAGVPQPLQGFDLNSVNIKQFDGSSISGSIQAIDADGKIQGAGLPANLNLRDVLSVATSRKTDKRPIYDVTLMMTDGGSLLVRNAEISDDRVLFRTGCGLTEIPLQTLRAIVWKSSERVEARIQDPSSDKDAVFVETGEGERRVDGIVEQMNREQLQINYGGDSRKIGLPKINAIVMADLGLDSPDGSQATINLTDGSLIKGVIAGFADGKLKVSLSGNSWIELPSDQVVDFSIASDRLQFLSDLKPLDVQQKTEFTIQRSWQPDRSVENNQLSVRYGKSDKILKFNKGLGTQAFTQLVFTNSMDFDRFRAIVGIDAETDGRGDCLMVVRGDGIELWSQRVQGSGEPVEVDLDISGMDRIALVVYPGVDFDLADHADWGNARFVRTK